MFDAQGQIERHLWMQAACASLSCAATPSEAAAVADEVLGEFRNRFEPITSQMTPAHTHDEEA